MNHIPANSMPQPSANIADSTPAAGDTDNPASAAFASLLAHKMEKSLLPTTASGSRAPDIANPFSSQERTAPDALNAILARLPAEMRSTQAEETGTVTDTPVTDARAPEAAIPANVPSVIMPHIPVEMRGTTVIDRATQLASGNRITSDAPSQRMAAAPTGSAASLPATIETRDGTPSAVRNPAITDLSIPMETRDGLPFRIEIPSQESPARQLAESATDTQFRTEIPTQDSFTSTGPNTPSDAAALTAHEQPLLRPDITSDLATGISQPNTLQMSAAPISQTMAALSGTLGKQAAGATLTVPTPLGSPAWGEDFTQKISWQVSQKIQVAELHLNPANLGPLDVVLKITDNQATAQFTSPHAAVREAVENALPKLREMLSDNGIMLSNASVGDQSPKRSMDDSGSRKGGASSGRAAADATTKPSAASLTLPTRRHNGLVDTFA